VPFGCARWTLCAVVNSVSSTTSWCAWPSPGFDTLPSPMSKVSSARIHRSASLLQALNLPDDDSRSGWDIVLPSARTAWKRLLSLASPASLASDARASGSVTPSASRGHGGGGPGAPTHDPQLAQRHRGGDTPLPTSGGGDKLRNRHVGVQHAPPADERARAAEAPQASGQDLSPASFVDVVTASVLAPVAALTRAPRPVPPPSSTVHFVGGAGLVENAASGPADVSSAPPASTVFLVGGAEVVSAAPPGHADVSSASPALGSADAPLTALGQLPVPPVTDAASGPAVVSSTSPSPPVYPVGGADGVAAALRLGHLRPPGANPTSSTEFLVGGDSQELSTSDGGGGADVVSPPAAPVPRGLVSPGDSVIGGGVVSWSTAPAQGPASAGGDDGGDVVTTLDRPEPSPWPSDAPAGNASKELFVNDGGGSVGVMSPSAAPVLRGSSPLSVSVGLSCSCSFPSRGPGQRKPRPVADRG